MLVKGTGQSFALMYLTFASTQMSPEQVTEFLTVVQPRFATLEGVGSAEILGGRDFAMRVWLDPLKLASRNVTATDVLASIRASIPRRAGQNQERIRRLCAGDADDAADARSFRSAAFARGRRPGGAASGRGARRTRPQEHRYHRNLQRPGRHLYRRDAEQPIGKPAYRRQRGEKGDRRDRPDAPQGHDGRCCV